MTGLYPVCAPVLFFDMTRSNSTSARRPSRS